MGDSLSHKTIHPLLSPMIDQRKLQSQIAFRRTCNEMDLSKRVQTNRNYLNVANLNYWLNLFH